MKIRDMFKKYKIKAKSFLTITFLTILEVVLILWYFDWQFNLAILPPLIQFILIFEKKDVWDRLTDDEKEQIMVNEEDLINLIRGVEKLCSEGLTTDEIVHKIKNVNED